MCGYVPGVNDIDAAGVPLSVPPETLASSPAERVLDAPELREHVLLAIDTALGSSVALGAGGRIYEVSSDDARGHAEVIGTLIARVFEFAGVSPSAVTGVVAGIGPGPFTGLRIGIAAAHAFAVGRAVPVLPLQGHEAVALAALQEGASGGIRVVQDAKRRELFVTEYSMLDWSGVPVRKSGPEIATREGFSERLGDLWPERIPAARLVQAAARRLGSGGAFEADRALYLRAPDVKPAAAVKRVSA
jgi:tRNA threonylcarbamoyl adenosine modification protein YeaZ